MKYNLIAPHRKQFLTQSSETVLKGSIGVLERNNGVLFFGYKRSEVRPAPFNTLGFGSGWVGALKGAFI